MIWEFDEVHVRCSGWSVSHLELALWRHGQGKESQVKGEYCSQQLTCTCVVNSEQNYVEIWYWCRSRLNFGQMLQKDGQLPQANKPMLVAIVSKFSNEGVLIQALCNKMASETLSWWRNMRYWSSRIVAAIKPCLYLNTEKSNANYLNLRVCWYYCW